MEPVVLKHIASLDVTANPKVATYQPNEMQYVGGRVFIASSGADWELLIIDVTDPTNPVQDDGFEQATGIFATMVWSDGTRCAYSAGLSDVMIDVSVDPPVQDDFDFINGTINDLVGFGTNYKYLVSTEAGTQTYRVLDMSNPAAISQDYSWTTGSNAPLAVTTLKDEQVQYFFSVSFAPGGSAFGVVSTYDFTDELNPPVLIGSASRLDDSAVDIKATTGKGGVGSDGKWVYVLNGTSSVTQSLAIYDVSDLTSAPVFTSAIAPGFSNAKKLYVGNGHAAVVDRQRLWLIDVSDSENPFVADTIINHLTDPLSIAGNDDYLFVGDDDTNTFEVFQYGTQYASSSSSSTSQSTSSSSSSSSSFEDFPSFLGPQSIVYDHVRSRGWWVQGSRVYMLDNLNNQVNSLLLEGYHGARAVEVEYSTGNAFIVATDDATNERYVIQLFRDNNRILGISSIDR